MGNYIKIKQKMWYVENEAVKIFLYYMRGWKKNFFCNILIIFHI